MSDLSPHLENLARQALTSFAADPEVARQYAQRLLSKHFSELREQGDPIGTDLDAQSRQRGELDAAIERLAPTLACPETPTGQPVSPEVHSPQQTPPDDAELAALVGRVFSAPTDGSLRRAQTLAARARSLVRQRLNASPTSWLTRWRLRRRAGALIAAEVARLTSGSDDDRS